MIKYKNNNNNKLVWSLSHSNYQDLQQLVAVYERKGKGGGGGL